MRLQHFERAKSSYYFGVSVRVNYTCFITFLSCTGILGASQVKLFQFFSVCMLLYTGSFAFSSIGICQSRLYISTGLCFELGV